ncbi:MAG TPA: AAA family ATPase, partial [Candidatus Dependentiae bacterium]|nr:AAA family ATPase [Candidatus Dependentiae bacterium]
MNYLTGECFYVVLMKRGKNKMIAAMEHESGCRTFRVTASELVGRYQGSGAEAIRSIFDRAKRVKANKGVMIVIDKLESLSPANYTDANLARENQNTL